MNISCDATKRPEMDLCPADTSIQPIQRLAGNKGYICAPLARRVAASGTVKACRPIAGCMWSPNVRYLSRVLDSTATDAGFGV